MSDASLHVHAPSLTASYRCLTPDMAPRNQEQSRGFRGEVTVPRAFRHGLVPVSDTGHGLNRQEVA
jgi:hypothetical protein